ncbi:AAA family ATPase [Catenulispora sp. NF23]|uniref:AAA family ATPase n=1 Tax=Catenulispora pinistramenti TaxID=2705254 RepID=A0ABS5KWV0_9ACTN|nr:AAA family ATPase [Catenulispora pinistramenti]MBS2533717.1 AAA family ATPase [Catenulispora pinistramenti]MBS2550440.1 AAA family ATPase [Catenulispora pinistramenti]
MKDAPAILGRQQTLEKCMAALAAGGGVLVSGPAGIGKSALLDAIGSACAAAGQLVLRSASAAAESWLPYLGLYDLFSDAVAARPEVVPYHLRSAFDGVLMRSVPDGAATDQLAIRVAVVEALRALSSERPVLLILDDVNCLDSATAEVLAFAVRRRQGSRVRVLAAERLSEGQEPTWWGLLPEDAVEIALGNLPGPVVSELLRTRLGLRPTDKLSQRIRDAAGGNPFYALELGRAALRSGTVVQPGDPLLVPERLRGLLADRLHALPKAARDALLLISTAARPPRELLAGHEWGLSQALASGIIVSGRDLEPRFAHPLLREIVYADADIEARRECHAKLAQAHDDPLERARHHALATADSTEDLAAELEEAARIAVHRGAPGTAAELFRMAAERTPATGGVAVQSGTPATGSAAARTGTPASDGAAARNGTPVAGSAVVNGTDTLSATAAPDAHDDAAATNVKPGAGLANVGVTPADTDVASRRLLEAARAAFDAGLPRQARDAAERVAAGPDPACRVGARMLLVELDDDISVQAALLEASEADAAGRPDLQARVSLQRADHAFRSGSVEAAIAALARAEEYALSTGDRNLRAESIAMRVPTEIQTDPERAIESLEEAEALGLGGDLTLPSIAVRKSLIIWFLRRGDVADALATASRLRADVERAGRLRDLGDVLHLVASVNERAGLCRQAHEAALLGSRLRAETGSSSVQALILTAAAELSGGSAEAAVEVAQRAIEAGTASGDSEFTGYAHAFLGRAELLLDRSSQAAHHLARGRTLMRNVGMVDPATFLVDADLAETLARCGSFSAADRILDEAQEAARRLERDVVKLGLTRARLLRHGLAADAREAADRLRAAIPAEHAYPLEIARAEVTLGELERRARRRAAARTAWESAAAAYAAAGCSPWLRFVQGRLARLDTPAEPLSATERQIVELVRSGATNRQIAAALQVSVKAVEGNLTRLFRRFGVSSRAELAGAEPVARVEHV